MRGNDTIARLGGDEFVALLEGVEPIEISEVARRILSAIEEPLEIDGYELQLSTSIGIAVHPRDGDTGATLMRNADAAMYEAKASGRNAFRFYTQELNQRASRHLALRSALNRAIERNEFELHYQPIVSCEDGRIVGAEALIRWRHADGHLAMPGEFLDVAEETGLIVPIGSWVLRAACAQAQQWWASGHAPVPVSVNVSAHQFRHGELVEVVRDALAESRLGAGLLTLEITESTVMTDLDRTAQTLASIASLGVVTAIDDFGTGHSSLSYLKRFPVRVLKIDRSFVTDAPKDADDAAIVRAVIDLAHALGMRVVAEGVETDEHVALLLSLGCDSMQGYRFGRPAPAADFEAMLRIGTIV